MPEADGPDWVRLCDAADVREGAPMRCVVDGAAYAVFRLDDGCHVLEDLCSHGPGWLSEGFEENGQVECPFHGGRFDVRTGQPTAAPCNRPVASWAAREADGGVWIRPGDRRPC